MDPDLVFLAVPHTAAMKIVPKLKTKVIDLSADYRFTDFSVYEKVYGVKHTDKRKAVFGLPELFRKEIKEAQLVANPGCFVTAAILAAAPLNQSNGIQQIIFDCKTGVSGAGHRNSDVNNFNNLSENVIPYKLIEHRHSFEIQQFIKHKTSFTPHVVPVVRGILCTAHILFKNYVDPKEIQAVYEKFYKDEPFVQVIESLPELHAVQNTNKCHIGGFEIEGNRLVVLSSIDNLTKGASTQAIQNRNLMLGFGETKGLEG